MSGARHNFWTVMVAFVVLNTITVGLRLWLRVSSHSFGHDDWATCLAYSEFADFTTIPPPCSDSLICKAFSFSFVPLSFVPLDMDMAQQMCSLGTTLCWRPRLVLVLAREGIAKLMFLAVLCCCAVAIPNSTVGRKDQCGFGLVSNRYNGTHGTKSAYRLHVDSIHRVCSRYFYFRVPMSPAFVGLGRWHRNMPSWINHCQHRLCCISYWYCIQLVIWGK